MAEHPILDTANNGFLTAALMAKVMSLHRRSGVWAGLTGAGWAAHLSAACSLMMSFLVPLAAADDVIRERPSGHVVMAATNVKPAKQVSVQTIEMGSQSGVRESLAIVIRGQAEWEDLWQRHASIKANLPPAPVVDFTKETVVGVFLGEKPTGGYDIEIVRAERIDGTLLISFAEKGPQAGAILTQALTQPFHIVRVAINGTGAVGFRRVS